jgi:hypothetical protein
MRSGGTRAPVWSMPDGTASSRESRGESSGFSLVHEHDSEKWKPVFGKDHAPLKRKLVRSVGAERQRYDADRIFHVERRVEMRKQRAAA